MPFDFVVFATYEWQVRALLEGHIDVAWNGPLAHVLPGAPPPRGNSRVEGGVITLISERLHPCMANFHLQENLLCIVICGPLLQEPSPMSVTDSQLLGLKISVNLRFRRRPKKRGALFS